jgi:TolA-binding protein
MNEPKRWIEEGPPEAVERLLEAAEAEKPSEGSLRRVLLGVGAGLGATGAAATAGAVATAGTGAALATGKAVAAGAWVKWVFLSVAAVGAGTVAVRQASNGSEAPPAALTVVTAPKPEPLATAVVPSVAATETVPPVVETPAAEEPPKPRVVAASKPASAPVAAQAPIDAERLAEEVRAVDRARSALAAGRASEALAALDEYDSRFGGARFAPEALYLRMQALLSLGRKAEAQSAAERLVRGYPKSPHTARARRVLETIP